MSQRFKRNSSKLKELYKASARSKKKIIQCASEDLLGALSDCACNILKGNVPLTTKQFKQLKKHHKDLKVLTKKSSKKSKKKTLQKGGFLGLLLRPLAQLLLGGN